MNCLGCLLILLIFAGPAFIFAILRLGGSMVLRFVNQIGATCIWLYESFLNIFRSEKKEVLNPFTGASNFDDIPQDNELTYTETTTPEKIFDETDGEYIDYTEL